ncbi:hypothetical protein CAPTEDRAFT_198397 [Capitella teleta]|uniref:Uncharacterized protein n=1 Tax=Capitella teleta TaxID=283909 RepID=R7UR46_CAPTE|nr:hypothetical protein CAPTEDRAFT_198397 [Capitella teleta]|eukprot:ELU06412.1 hypothetical protein CAPTEDRAFT_198397 [Capitella teleta]
MYYWHLIVIMCSYQVPNLLFLVGFASPDWINMRSTKFGLWQQCAGGLCATFDIEELQDYHRGTQAVLCMALVAGLVASICFYQMIAREGHKHELITTSIICIYIQAILELIGGAVFGAKTAEVTEAAPNGYGYWLIIAACLLHLIFASSLLGCGVPCELSEGRTSGNPESYAADNVGYANGGHVVHHAGHLTPVTVQGGAANVQLQQQRAPEPVTQSLGSIFHLNQEQMSNPVTGLPINTLPRPHSVAMTTEDARGRLRPVQTQQGMQYVEQCDINASQPHHAQLSESHAEPNSAYDNLQNESCYANSMIDMQPPNYGQLEV